MGIPPDLAVPDGALSSAVFEQAVVTIGLFQRQSEHDRGSLDITGQYPRQLKSTRKSIQPICVNQSTIGQAQLKPGGHKFAQLQCIRIKRYMLDTPGMDQDPRGDTLISPGLEAGLLLKLLSR